MMNFSRNSSSSDEERRHTPSPPGSNPHRVKRFVSVPPVSVSFVFINTIITSIILTTINTLTFGSPRALFGPTDHEENLRFVRKELKKAKNEAANKWYISHEMLTIFTKSVLVY